MKQVMLKRILLGALLIASPAWAQQGAILVFPNTLVTNSTISVTNTFQSALAAPLGKRNGCLIQNQGTHTMYIFTGAVASATTASSMQLSPGQTFNCASGPIVVQDVIAITGTSGDAYVVNAQ